MSKLESALLSLNSLSRPLAGNISSAAWLAVTVIYLVAVLSIPLSAPERLVWFAVYPVVQSEVSGIGFARVFMKSLWVLPLVVMVGIFNPFIDRETAFTIGGVIVSKGWVSFFSIALRGILAVQALVLLTLSAGFYDVCDSLRRMGCPRILVTQMQFTYRYMMVIIEEAVWMDRARKSRGFGRGSYPLRMWGRMVGQLLVRSYDRASRINRAMLARGFDGSVPVTGRRVMDARSWLFIAVWTSVVVVLRFVNLSALFI